MNTDSNQIEKSAFHNWIEAETRQLDVVASWESLCDTYRSLEFADPLEDAAKMEEFKWIIENMNRHLSRTRKKLLSCSTPETAVEVLTEMFYPTGKVNISDRKSLAYHKLRQRWIMQMISNLEELSMMMEEMKEENDGQSEYWDD